MRAENTGTYYGVTHSAECREAQREERAKFAARVKQQT